MILEFIKDLKLNRGSVFIKSRSGEGVVSFDIDDVGTFDVIVASFSRPEYLDMFSLKLEPFKWLGLDEETKSMTKEINTYECYRLTDNNVDTANVIDKK